MASKQGAVKKKQQIRGSNKQMLAWVIAVSIVVGISGVVCWFLFQNLAFRTKVVNEKKETVTRLQHNNSVVEALRDNIRVLETNEALNSVKANDDDKALQVVLDALPADVNSLALGASLQNKLAADISGLTIEALEAKPAAEDSTDGQIAIRIMASADNPNALKELLTRLEKSIRVVDITQLLLERSSARYTMTLEAHAYYEPAKTTDLTTKVVKP